MKIDKFLVAVSISIFILAGLWNLTEVLYGKADTGFDLPGIGVAVFLGWATFYAAGAGKGGVIKGIPANMSGIFWGVIIILIWDNVFGFNDFGAFLSVAIGAGMLCFQAHLKIFAFIPGAFIGTSTFFALGAVVESTTLWPAILGLIIGVLLGYVSEEFAKLINKKLLKG